MLPYLSTSVVNFCGIATASYLQLKKTSESSCYTLDRHSGSKTIHRVEAIAVGMGGEE